MRPQARLVLVLALAMASLGVSLPASGATTFTRDALDAVVARGVVTVTTTVSATPATPVQQLGVCVRSSTGAIVDVSPKLTNLTVSASGSRYTGQRSYAVGRYRYYACIQRDGSWSRVGEVKYFEVGSGSGAILFEDDFSGAAGRTPDAGRWRDYSGCANAKQAFGMIRCSSDETLNGSGQLSVPAAPTWGSGLSTAGTFGFTYGTASAWIKTPRTTGYWPAFWTENRPADFHDVPLYGEMDAMEIYTFAPQYAHGGGMHAWGASGQLWGGTDNYCTAPGVSDFGDGYHKYSVRFEPDKVTGFIDDVQCGPVVTRSSDPGRPWPFAPDVALQNYLILDLAVGGAGGQQPTPPRGDAMLVDRVEVRAL